MVESGIQDMPLPKYAVSSTVSTSRQIVILVGGKGTRLGHETRNTPKPLMAIDEDRVFLDFLLDNVVRQGFRHIIMIAGYYGEQIVERYAYRRIGDAQIDVVIEPVPMGTGGALAFVKDILADRFVLMNGDTLFETNLRAIDSLLSLNPTAKCAMALRHVDDVGRYGAVKLNAADKFIEGYQEKSVTAEKRAGLINGGIYAMHKSVIDLIPDQPISLEADILPRLIEKRQVLGQASDGYFLDIGLPETLRQARKELPMRQRPVLFLDRDGVVNVDHGYTHTIDAWEWIPGAFEVIKKANDSNISVVIVTNQSGIARGYYEESDVWRLHGQVNHQLNIGGAFIDSFYYCPDYPDAVIDAYRVKVPLGRKPDPTMLSRAIRQHNLDPKKALLIGDQQTDIEAAFAVGIPALRFGGGRLDDFLFNTDEWSRLCS